eukprot:TRINITY_DN10577_c0_g5_i1.p1 TRINITY_DN10577_c0_g5~~TRINITY_DN10577_c0_g5_i1.p1  ORF type:complete len:322 (+),score=48.24 TRINITY_DN10577_c0_g5_i1:3-968(+)
MRKAQAGFFETVESETKSKRKTVAIALIVDQVVIVLLLAMLVPFILKMQSGLLKIYLHLCQFKSSTIAEWVETCNESASCIKASIGQIYRMHSKESFEIKPLNVKEENTGRVIHFPQNPKNESNFVKPPANNNGNCEKGFIENEGGAANKDESQDEEMDQLLRSKEETISKRKQKMFSKITRSKTMVYLTYSGIFLLYVAIFRVTDGLVFSSVYSQTGTVAYVYEILSCRSYYGHLGIFFLREEFKRDQVLTDFECNLYTVEDRWSSCSVLRDRSLCHGNENLASTSRSNERSYQVQRLPRCSRQRELLPGNHPNLRCSQR